jgi:hypothetical protein
MSYISEMEFSLECGPLGELEFRIEFEYEPEDRACNSLDDFNVLMVKVNLEDRWVTLTAYDFNKQEDDWMREKASEMYAAHLEDDESDRADYLNERAEYFRSAA